jgi:hypothetical protein
MQSILNIIPKLLGMGPEALALLGAVVVTLTAFQAFLYAIQKACALLASFLPGASKPAAFFLGAARVVGIGATDIGKAIEALKSFAGWIGGLATKSVGNAAKVALVLLVAFVLSGCAGSFEESRGSVRVGAPELSQRCIDLDDRHAFWGGTSKFAGALAGISGLAAIPVDSKEARIGLAAGGAFLGASAVGAMVISESAATAWARECAR